MTLRKIIGALAVFSVFAMPAFAAETPHRGGPAAAACKQDAQTFCQGVKQGEGRIAACLKANREKVSDGCKTAIKAAHGRHKGEPGAKKATGTT